MKRMSQFVLSDFVEYRECPNQYTDTFIKEAEAVKISETDDLVRIAVSNGKITKQRAYLTEFHFPKSVKFEIVPDADFAEFIGKVLDHSSHGDWDREGYEACAEFALDKVSASAPVINIINAICLEAIRKRVSDIHIQPERDVVRIRYRIDGVLQTVKELEGNIFPAIATRIKVMAHLNVMEQRLPQDGRMKVEIDGILLDFRVSFVPVSFGESIVLRLFNTSAEISSIQELGFSDLACQYFNHMSILPYGLILVTGPTGSGKTTTLHSLIGQMDRERKKIITIEDPVERTVSYIDQVQVNDSIGLSFDVLLRRLLRQDPDVIMVGEIRDSQTADLAIRGALTGHLILSTLHTNDCISTITRLKDMGVESYLIAAVLKYIVAQRLVRRVCPHCMKFIPVPSTVQRMFCDFSLSVTEIVEAVGCEKCSFTGYIGRIALSEVLKVTAEIEEMIATDALTSEIREAVRREGMKSLQEDALVKLAQGVTTIEELQREGIV